MNGDELNAGVLKAIRLVGSEQKLAKLLGVPRHSVYYWKTRSLPPHRALQIHEACPKVRKHELRPDLW